MRQILASVLAAFSMAAAAQSGTAVAVENYTVFVDPPTGFTFVKMPAGWKFVGRVGAEDVARLPATVVTWLLPAEEGRAIAASGDADNVR